ncbi:hypothetical protein TSAR_001669 [Trichomalopsis sarcophagae]|uniref:Uncharacterized protein n=1 Tax=Trichomalopsis sarcophagae TaxID=543379 RepID=A0A232EFU4_9HYME|nr:hypothetical protein TSAR_001669 [Trichomalopsis sarcophagae]
MASALSIFGYYKLPVPTVDDLTELDILEVRRYLAVMMEKEWQLSFSQSRDSSIQDNNAPVEQESWPYNKGGYLQPKDLDPIDWWFYKDLKDIPFLL